MNLDDSGIRFYLSLSQLTTMLNMVSEEHVTEGAALDMLTELGITISPHPSPTLSSPPNPRRHPPHSSLHDHDMSSLAAGFQQSMSIQDKPARGQSASSTTTTPSHMRTKASASSNLEASPSLSRLGYAGSEVPNEQQTVTDFSPALLRTPSPSPYVEQGGPTTSRTTVGCIPSDLRWYTVTRGEKIGAVQGW